jgi:hypothetical protein
VSWIGVDAAEPGDLDFDPGLFTDLAADGSSHGLTDVLRTPRQSPKTVVCALDQQHLAAVITTTAAAATAILFAFGASGSP